MCKFGREETRELTSGLHPGISVNSRKGKLATTRTLNILPSIKNLHSGGEGVKREMATAESCVLLEGGSLSAVVILTYTLLIETMPFKCTVL